MAAACGGSDAEVFDELLCPLSRRLFFDPVTLPCGHSFSRAPLVMALGARRECPLCRSPFFSPATQLARNFALASIVEHRFPEAYKRRLEEAEEDGETAPATGMLDLPVAFIACNTPTAQPAPDAAGAEHVFPPGFPIDLVFFEPRYLALIDRVMGTTARRFAVQPTRDAAMGAVVRAESARRTPDGRVHVKAAVECRYRVLSRSERLARLAAAAGPAAATPSRTAAPAAGAPAPAPAPAEESAAGAVAAAAPAADAGLAEQARTPAPHASPASPPAASGVAPAHGPAAASGLAVEELEGMGGLCLVWCEPVHDKDETARGAAPADGGGSDNSSLVGSRSNASSRLARFAARLVAQAGAAALPINAHFGQPPLRPGPLTFYLSALLDLSAEERRRAMQTELLSERQQLLLDFLLRIAAQSDKSADAAAGAGRAGAAAGGAAAGGAAAGGAAAGGAAAGGDGGTLRHRRDRGAGPEAIAAGSRAAAADAAPEAGEAGAAGSRGDGPGTTAAAQPVLAAGATAGDDCDPLDRVEAGRALWMLSRTRLGRKSTLLGGFSQAQGPLAALSTLLLLVVVLLLAGNRAAWEANHGDLA